MRVLGMFHGYIPHHNAGAELTVHAMLRHLARRGHQVDVQLSRQHPDVVASYEVDGVRVHPYRDTGDVIRQIVNHGADVIVSHLENQIRACALGDLHAIPVVHVLHNTHAFAKDALRRGPTALAVFNTDWMRADYERWFAAHGLDLPPAITIHPPVHLDDYRVADHKGRAVTLINLWDGKGGQLFWELARRFPKKPFLGVRGAYGEQVLPDGWRADEAYDHVGVMPHCPPHKMRDRVYSQTRVLLMPSEYESYGRTAIEAACSGIPTIAHPTPGLVEALGDGGTFVHRDDVEGWLKELGRLSTPRGWALASRKAKTVAEGQTPDADLNLFANAMEGVVARGFAHAG